MNLADSHRQKDYGDYFEKLEQRLSGREQPAPARPKAAPVPAKKSKRFRVIRIRPIALFGLLFLVLLLVVLIPLLSALKGETKATAPSPAQAQTSSLPKESNPAAPSVTFSETDQTVPAPASNDAESLLMAEIDSGHIVTARNPHKRMSPASTTKIMTVLTASDLITDYDDVFEMTIEITDAMYLAEATVAGFSAGERVTVLDLMYGTILPSGGDAALGLAIKLAGSEAAFAEKMNQKAAALGLTGSHFVNVTGLYHADHYTTAYDLAVILCEALKDPVVKKVLSTYRYTTKATAQHPDGIELSATLFDYMYGTEPETATILGGKTGFVNESGYCIASYGANNATGKEYVAVTLKNSGRWPAFYGQIDLYKDFAK